MNQAAATQISRARAMLILDQPFFGSLALRMQFMEDTSVKTMATNGVYVKYNPDFVLKNSGGLNKAVVAHEVMHCVLDHIRRLSGRSHRRWNQAGDFVINQLLTDVGFDFEGTGLLDPAFKGMSADQVYSLLPETESNEPGDRGDPLDDMEPGTESPAEQEQQADDWKIATIQAANAAKIMGKLPAALERFVDGLLKPQVDWKAVLRRFVTERSKNDYSWMRPNRAMLVHGVYMPSLYSESMGDIVIGVDTSGSISQTVLDAFSAECEAVIAATLPANVHVVYCDSHVNRAESFARYDEFKLTACGGGGTAFKPVFDYVDEKGLRPVCLIYLTDLYGDHSFSAPEYPTLWCCTTDEVGSFGETVRIEV